MNYYEHHIGDYDADTAHLSWLEDMAYTRLMRLYYRKEAPIPADVAQACRLVRAQSKDERAAVDTVLREFFVLRDDGWHQDRCDAEVAAYQERVEHNRRVGKKGGRPRKTPVETEPENNPQGLKTEPEQNPPGYFREPEQNPPQTPDPNTSTSLRSVEGRASRLPADWSLPDGWRAWALTERPELNPERTAASFADYWRGKAGKDGRKADWLATWRNWVRNERTQAQRRQPSEPKYAAAARSIFGVTTPQQEIVDVTPS